MDKPVIYEFKQQLNQFKQIANFLNAEVQKIEEDDALDSKSKFTKSMELLNANNIRAFLGDAARSIAYLSAVDGAALLDREFGVLSFGAKLKLPNNAARAKTVIRISPYDDSDPVEIPIEEEFRGTRHMSAAQYVFNNSGATAFVVSQDGGITGLVLDSTDLDKSTSRLLAYRGLELLL